MSKHTQKYWEDKVRERPGIGGLQIRIQYQGEQHWFNLLTSDRQEAAAKARAIWLSLHTVGLQKTLEVYKPRAAKPKCPTTIGAWLAAVKPHMIGKMKSYTWDKYAGYARTIAAEMTGKDSDKRKYLRSAVPEKYREWITEVDGCALDLFRDDPVKKWIQKRIERVSNNPAKLASAKRTLNSIIAALRSMFDKKLVSELMHVPVPEPAPFSGIPFFEKGDCKYVSKINAQLLLVSAINTLKPKDTEAYKVFLLALCAGLRRHEIDLIEWGMVDFERGIIALRETDVLALKTASSSRAVSIDPEIMAELRVLMPLSKSKYVITCEHRGFRSDTMRLYYRCEPVFQGLIKWLRERGVTALKPIHELRKEFTSLIANEYGIFAASMQARHSDIRTTAAHYADKQRAYTVGLGAILKPTEPEPTGVQQNP